MKQLYIRFFIFFLLNNISTEKIDFVPQEPTCNRQLVKSFGFSGFDQPTATELLMCPTIQNSCCTTFDQEELYSIWVINKQRQDIEERFEFYGEVYNRLLKKGENFHKFLLEIIKTMKIKTFSNCKIITSRLAQFQFKTVSEQLQEAIKNMYQYYQDIYTGFYCTMCDADSQPFFRSQKKQIIFQKKFCRDIISQSLNVLLYQHINLKKYFNLATRFMSNCDFEGNYKKSDSDDAYIFKISEENHKLLTECKAYRNENFWMDYCEPICQKFNIFNLDNFFFPDLKQFAFYNKFFGDSLNKLQQQQEKARKKQEKLQKKEVRGLMDYRILEEKNKEEEDDEDKHKKTDEYYMELVESYNSEPIYYEPAKVPYEISKFKSVFADSDLGIDMTVIGKQTKINEKIKQFLDAEKKVIAQQQLQENNKQQLEEVTKELVSGSKKKKDKKIQNTVASISIFTTMFSILFILFSNQLFQFNQYHITNIIKSEDNYITVSKDQKNKNPIMRQKVKIQQKINSIIFQNEFQFEINYFLKYKQQAIQKIECFILAYLLIVLRFM